MTEWNVELETLNLIFVSVFEGRRRWVVVLREHLPARLLQRMSSGVTHQSWRLSNLQNADETRPDLQTAAKCCQSVQAGYALCEGSCQERSFPVPTGRAVRQIAKLPECELKVWDWEEHTDVENDSNRTQIYPKASSDESRIRVSTDVESSSFTSGLPVRKSARLDFPRFRLRFWRIWRKLRFSKKVWKRQNFWI